MRLLKLLAYGLVGYTIYELVQQITAADRHASDTGQSIRGGYGQFHGDTQGVNMTGPGEGMPAEVSDSSGVWQRQTVGRGVIH